MRNRCPVCRPPRARRSSIDARSATGAAALALGAVLRAGVGLEPDDSRGGAVHVDRRSGRAAAGSDAVARSMSRRRARSESRARCSPRSAGRRCVEGTPRRPRERACARTRRSARREPRTPRRSSGRRRCAPRPCRTRGAGAPTTTSWVNSTIESCARGSPRSPYAPSRRARRVCRSGEALGERLRAGRVQPESRPSTYGEFA